MLKIASVQKGIAPETHYWIKTLQSSSQLDPTVIQHLHGPIATDKNHSHYGDNEPKKTDETEVEYELELALLMGLHLFRQTLEVPAVTRR